MFSCTLHGTPNIYPEPMQSQPSQHRAAVGVSWLHNVSFVPHSPALFFWREIYSSVILYILYIGKDCHAVQVLLQVQKPQPPSHPGVEEDGGRKNSKRREGKGAFPE